MSADSPADVQRWPNRPACFDRLAPAIVLAVGLGLVLLAGAGLSVIAADRTPLVASQLLALLGYGVVAWRTPAATVPTLIFTLYTRLSDYLWPVDWQLSLSQIVVALTLTGLLRQRGLRWRDPLILGLLAYAAAMLLSAPTSLNRFGTLAEVVAYLRDVLIITMISALIVSYAELRRALWALVAGAALLALLSWVNLVTGAELSGLAGNAIQCEGSVCAARFDGPAGIDNNYFAQLLLTAVPLALTLYSTARPHAVRLTALATAALVIYVTLGTFSRGGYIGLVVVLGWMVWHARRTPRRLLWATAVLILTLIATPPISQLRIGYVVDRLIGRPVPAADSQEQRSSLALVGITMLLDHPLTGVGKGSYFAAYPSYAPRVDPELPARPKGAHNLAIQIGAETGFIGLTAFTCAIVVALRRLRGARRQLLTDDRSSAEQLLSAVELAIYGFLLCGMFLGDNVYLRYLWLLVGIAAAAPRFTRTTGIPRPRGGGAM